MSVRFKPEDNVCKAGHAAGNCKCHLPRVAYGSRRTNFECFPTLEEAVGCNWYESFEKRNDGPGKMVSTRVLVSEFLSLHELSDFTKWGDR